MALPAIALLFAMVMGLASMSSSAQPAPPPIAIEQLQTLLLRDPVRYWVTDEVRQPDDLPLEEFRPLTDNQINRGITDAHHWLWFRLSNDTGDEPLRWILHHETSYLDEMSVYVRDDQGDLHSSHLTDRQPFGNRPVDYRTLAFEHITPAESTSDVLVRLHFTRGDTMSLNLYLSQANEFYNHSRQSYFAYGIYFGLMTSLLLGTLVLAALLQRRLYLAYSLFLVCSILLWGQLNGFFHQYLWPNQIYLQNQGYHIVFLLLAISAIWFSQLFLKTRTQWPRIHRLMQAVMLVYAGGIALRLTGVHAAVLYLSFIAIASLILLAPLGYCAYRAGMHYARWYTLAWSIYGTGLLLSIFSAWSSWFSWGMQPLLYAQIGSLLEAILLLVALGERLKSWQRDHHQAVQLAAQDPLTGLGNRRALEQALEELIDQPGGTSKPLFLIMMDMDNFKEINDRFGHEAGDQVLREFAELLRDLSRPGDICVRYGGEEFALLLQAPGLKQVKAIAERIRTRFASKPSVYRNQTIDHQVSMGISQTPADWNRDTITELFHQADSALYLAKSSGRNRTMVYE